MTAVKSLVVAVAFVTMGLAVGTPAQAWTCAETHYECEHGTSGNHSESATEWTWTCSDEEGSIACSEDKPPVDVCPNVDGNQSDVPQGQVIVDDQCVTPPKTEDPVCGNGIKEAGEACDDGNGYGKDDCDNSCQPNDDDDDKDKKKKKKKDPQVLPATGLPLAGVAGIALSTAGLYLAVRRMKRK